MAATPLPLATPFYQVILVSEGRQLWIPTGFTKQLDKWLQKNRWCNVILDSSVSQAKNSGIKVVMISSSRAVRICWKLWLIRVMAAWSLLYKMMPSLLKKRKSLWERGGYCTRRRSSFASKTAANRGSTADTRQGANRLSPIFMQCSSETVFEGLVKFFSRAVFVRMRA